MKTILFLLMLTMSVATIAQKKEQPIKYDTIKTIELNKLQLNRVSTMQREKAETLQKISQQYEAEYVKVLIGILEANGFDPSKIDGDSLRLQFTDKIFIIRKKK